MTLTTDRSGLTDHFILSISEIATCGEYSERIVIKISTLDFTLLLVFIIFTIVWVNKNLIFGEVILETRVVFRHQTILKFSFPNRMCNQRKPACFEHIKKHKQNKQILERNLKESVTLRVELCKDEIYNLPLQIEMQTYISHVLFVV